MTEWSRRRRRRLTWCPADRVDVIELMASCGWFGGKTGAAQVVDGNLKVSTR